MTSQVDCEQSARLTRIAVCAAEIREKLAGIILGRSGQAHFRPTDSGITLVGLLPDRPQRGRGGYTAEHLLAKFETEFRRHCLEVPQGRDTPEKVLQSFIISRAYRDGRRLGVLQTPSSRGGLFADVLFVTDELAVLTEAGKSVCDLLALRYQAGRMNPALIELKSERHMSRLVEQLDSYAKLVERFRTEFERIYSAVLGKPVRFTGPPERWLVWPGPCTGPDRREVELARAGIGVVQYKVAGEGFSFWVGQRPKCREAR